MPQRRCVVFVRLGIVLEEGNQLTRFASRAITYA